MDNIIAVWDGYETDEWYWDDFIEEVNTMVNNMNTKKFFCYGLSLTWRNVAGYTEFETDRGDVLLEKITPNTNFGIKFLKTDNKGVIEVVTYHHDAPTGEVMYLMSQSMAKKLKVKETYFK